MSDWKKSVYKKVTLLSTILVCILISSTNAVSETDNPNIETWSNTWTGEAELGFVSTSGNTETKTVNAKGKISIEISSWRYISELSALKSSNRISTTTEKYGLSGQSDYKFSEYDYFFASLRYEDDRFSGYDYRISEAVGYGRRVIENAKMTLDLELGPGARQSKFDSGVRSKEALLRGAFRFAWTISRASKFEEIITVDAGEDVTITKSVTGLTNQIVGSLAMKISHTVNHTSKVPAGKEKTDSETGVTLVYSF